MRYLLGLALALASSAVYAGEPDVRPMGQSDSYTYSVDALRLLVDDPGVVAFQLVLAWGADDTLQAAMVAVDADGASVDVVPGAFVDRAIDVASLNAMDDITAEERAAQAPALAAHLLHPGQAATFITDWATLRHGGAPLAPALTQEGASLLWHTIEKVMVADIVTRAEAAELVVVWGLNPAGKLTPVLMGVDHADAPMIGSVGEIGFAMDFTRPCPATCQGGGYVRD